MKTVKLYIEPASLPLTQQLLNYIRSYKNDNIVNIIAFQRLKVNTNYTNKKNTVFIDNVNIGLNEKLTAMANFIKGVQPSRVEVHTNIHRERDILFPMMKLLAPFFSLDNIKLHLYDDGSGSLIERDAIESLDSVAFDHLMQQRKKQLLAVLKATESKEYTWNIIDNYIWHYLVDTQYYFISSRKKNNTNAFYNKIERHVIYTNFNLQKNITPEEQQLLLKLVNFPMALYHKLEQLNKDPNALMFVTSYCLDPVKAMTYHQRLIALIQQLKTDGKIPDSAKVIFKGHPENKKLNHEISQAIGNDVLCVPDEIPIEFLSSFNLLPHNVGGEFSSTFFCMKDINVEFVILKGREAEMDNKIFCEIANKYNAFEMDKVIYL